MNGNCKRPEGGFLVLMAGINEGVMAKGNFFKIRVNKTGI